MKNEPVVFDGDVSEFISSQYYKKSDFEDVDEIPLVIAGVERIQFEDK